MHISMIVAMDENQAIGFNNDLPWRLRTDMQNFKRLTMGHHLILGRKTFESIGRPLPGRTMLVLSRNPDYEATGCQVIDSLECGLSIAREAGDEEVFIGGGAAVYAQAIQHATRIYLTRVHSTVPADTFFPTIDLSRWQLVSSAFHPQDPDNQFPFTFYIYQR